MLEKVISKKSNLERHLSAPLLKERECYLRYVHDKGNNGHCSLLCLASHMLRIVELLHLTDEDKSLISIKDVRDAAEEWAKMGASGLHKDPYSPISKEKLVTSATKWLKHIRRLEPLIENSVSIFNELFKRAYTRRKMVAAPLLNERVEYIQYWKNNGAARNTLRIIAKYELHIIKYLSITHLRVIGSGEIRKAAQIWAKEENVTGRTIEYSPNSEMLFFRYANGWLKFMKCLNKEKDMYPFEDMAVEYLDYLVCTRGYSTITSQGRYKVLKKAFNLLGKQCHSLLQVTPRHIDNIIARMHEEKMSRRSIAGLASILRSFFLYAEQKGWCMENIAISIKSPRIYSEENIPHAPQRENMKLAVQYYNTDNKSAIRNYAILQIFVVYGIRSCELTNLKLVDLDWKKEQLYLKRAKGCRPQTFPLVRSVGDAILRYFKEVRQNESHSEYVFLCMDAPYRQMSTSAVYKIVSDSLKQQNIVLKHYGAHSLRHGSATLLVNSGFTLKEVSEYLGHQSLNSTRIYAKVDLLNLRKVADMNWEGLL